MLFSSSNAPLVSVLMPAYRADPFIERAVDSVLLQSYRHLEVVVSPDDGQSYAWLLQKSDARVRVLNSDCVRSGPGAARNRALESARGEYYTVLDADDYWLPGYLAKAMALALREGACFARSNLVSLQGAEVRTPLLSGPVLDVLRFSRALCSLRPTLHRSLEPGYTSFFAEDVLHDAGVLVQLGSAPLLELGYCQTVHPTSTAASTASADINQQYLALAQACRTQPERVRMPHATQCQRESVAQLFLFRLAASKAFELSGIRSYEEWRAREERLELEQLSARP